MWEASAFVHTSNVYTRANKYVYTLGTHAFEQSINKKICEKSSGVRRSINIKGVGLHFFCKSGLG